MVSRPASTHKKRRAQHGPDSLTRYWWLALTGLFFLSLVWRFGYVSRLGMTALSGTLRGDERVYWDWATFLMDHGFRGTHAFFLGPLYPYLLALIRLVVGSQPLHALFVQAAWGATAVVLLADSARRLTRPAVALGFGVLMALYEMAVFFDGLILMESLVFFLEALLLWLWCRSADEPGSTFRWAVIALVTGLAAQCRATGALLLIPGLVLAARPTEPKSPARMARFLLMIAVFAMTMLPAALWNWSVTREFIPFTYNGGFNLHIGNHPAADGGYAWVASPQSLGRVEALQPDGGVELDGRDYLRKRRGLALSPAQSSAHWTREAIAFMRQEPGRALELAGVKLLLLVNHAETPQIESVGLFRRVAGPLGLPWVGTFAVVGALGLMGLVFAGRWQGMGWALRLYVGLMTVGIVPFFVTDRYRLHLVPALALLAAMAVETLVVGLTARPRRGLRRWGVVAGAAVVLVALPLSGGSRGHDEWQGARSLGIRWLEKGRPDLAVGELRRAVEIERALGLDRDPDPSVTQGRAQLYFNYGVALRRTGQEDAALEWLRAAAETEPENPRYVRTLGDLHLVRGNRREGDSLLRRVGSMVGGEGEALLSEGWQAAREGRLEQAEDLLHRAVASDGRLYGAWGALIRIQVQRGELDRARETLLRATRTGMSPDVLKAHEALVAAARGDSLGAWRALAQVSENAVRGDPTLARVVSGTRAMLERGR